MKTNSFKRGALSMAAFVAGSAILLASTGPVFQGGALPHETYQCESQTCQEANGFYCNTCDPECCKKCTLGTQNSSACTGLVKMPCGVASTGESCGKLELGTCSMTEGGVICGNWVETLQGCGSVKTCD